jgi:hypothetical protein
MSQLLTQNLDDIVTAAPAAFARILLGNRADPRIRFLLSIAQKVTALLGSLAFATMAGQIARSFTQTTGYATVIVIAAAFTAQDACIALIRKSQRKIKEYEHDRN